MKTEVAITVALLILAVCIIPWEPIKDETTLEVETAKDRHFTEMEVTAYCPCEKCCGKWADGFFADGSKVGGKAIAADTSIYPMGTTFDVPGYGVATVKDRGGAIKGNKLDIFFSDKDGISGHQRALNWGRKKILVEIIK